MKRAFRIASFGLLTGSAVALVAGMAVAEGPGRMADRGERGFEGRPGQVMQHRGGMRNMPISFEELDADGDGQITLADIEAKSAERFAETDANGDGSLTHEELTAAGVARFLERYEAQVAAAAPGEVPGRPSDVQIAARAEKMATKVIERADSDNSGTIEAGEMSNGRGERLIARADTDGDGAVSAAEFEAAKAKMGERMRERMQDRMHDRGHDRDGHRASPRPGGQMPMPGSDGPAQ